MMSESNPYARFGDYQWPKSLYDELSTQGDLAKMCYVMGYLVDAAREAKKQNVEFYGIVLDETNVEPREQFTRSGVSDAELCRCFTPKELKETLEQNAEFFKTLENENFDDDKLKSYYDFLDDLQKRAETSKLPRPLALEEFDDIYQTKELVYGVTRDSINKRITVVFRGTLSGYSEYTWDVSKSNWFANLDMIKKKGKMPDCLKDKVGDTALEFHRGFYDYLFGEAEDKTSGKTKYDQIMDDVKSLLAKYPDHKVYTTGHSLGGALATLCGFYLATEEDLPKPVSSINFAAPRVGGGSFPEAVMQLEKERLFRLCRSVNENDTVTTIPPGVFKHVGFQVTAFPPRFWNGTPKPEIVYINPNPSFREGLRYRWTNGVLSNLNLGYDHGMGEYLKRIKTAKPSLEATSLNQLYMHQKWFLEGDGDDV